MKNKEKKMKTRSPHQFHEKTADLEYLWTVYERWMCCSMWVLCVLSLRKCLCIDKKKRKKRKKNNSIHLGPFLPLTAWHRPMINQITATPNPKKKCLAQCFPSHVFYLRKKQPFGFTKKAKSQTEKLRIAIKTKREWKKKKSSKQRLTPHTHTLPEAPHSTHLHTNSPKLHP